MCVCVFEWRACVVCQWCGVCVCVFACVDVRDTKWKTWGGHEGELTL